MSELQSAGLALMLLIIGAGIVAPETIWKRADPVLLIFGAGLLVFG